MTMTDNRTAGQIAEDEAFDARMAGRDAQLDYVRSLSEADARVLMQEAALNGSLNPWLVLMSLDAADFGRLLAREPGIREALAAAVWHLPKALPVGPSRRHLRETLRRQRDVSIPGGPVADLTEVRRAIRRG